MTVKRLIPVLLTLVLLAAGCSAQGSGNGAAKDVDPGVAAKAIFDEVEFRDDLVKAEDGAAEMYYRLDETIVDYAIYISGSGATAEEIAVLKVAEGTEIAGATAILEKRVEDLKFRFEDYVPEEMVKLGDPVIVTAGDVAALVLADDSAAAKKAVEGQLK